MLFHRASDDDLKLYGPEMLAYSAIHSARELAAWDGRTPRVSIGPVANVEPGGVPVSVLSVTDHNKPFLFESVMGEVTSSHRDLYMAVHPMLVVEEGKAPEQELLMVVSDIEMPEMDGYTLTAEIRNDPRMQKLHILLHTSLSGVFNQAMVKKVGADDFLAKFKPDDLAARVVERIKATDGG